MVVVLVIFFIAALVSGEDRNWEYDPNNDSYPGPSQTIFDRIIDWIIDYNRVWMMVEKKDVYWIDNYKYSYIVSCFSGRVGHFSTLQRHGPAYIIVEGHKATLVATLSMRSLKFIFRRCAYWNYNGGGTVNVTNPKGIILSNLIKLQISWNTTKGAECHPVVENASVSHMGLAVMKRPNWDHQYGSMFQVNQHVRESAIKVINTMLKSLTEHIIDFLHLCSMFVKYTQTD